MFAIETTKLDLQQSPHLHTLTGLDKNICVVYIYMAANSYNTRAPPHSSKLSIAPSRHNIHTQHGAPPQTPDHHPKRPAQTKHLASRSCMHAHAPLLAFHSCCDALPPVPFEELAAGVAPHFFAGAEEEEVPGRVVAPAAAAPPNPAILSRTLIFCLPGDAACVLCFFRRGEGR